MKPTHLAPRIIWSCLYTATVPSLQAAPIADFECDSFRYAIGDDARSLHFIDKATGADWLAKEPPSPCARLKKAGRGYPATGATRNGDVVRIEFADAGVTADLRLTPQGRRLVIEVARVDGGALDELVFIDVPLKLQGKPGEPFAACCLALNLKTNVNELPGPNSRLRAMCYPRFGTAGAQAALVACPAPQLRPALQDAVAAAPELPHSPLGGPWALDGEINQGSYLFNFTGLTEQTADDWIRAAKAAGMNQIDFHGGHSFRFGDVRFNPELYPRGKESMKAVIDKLHAAGIKAGLHTYAFFLDKSGPYVSPVPDPRLGKDATFTLADALAADAAVVPVAESTEKMSATTGFFVQNSVTLQIDSELIVYTGVNKQPPFAFTGCQRGACGTKAAPHARGAKVHHLRECFGLFLPDGESTLFEEVAANTANAVNDCGFDMMYLDALDGEGVVAGPEAGWYYGSKFAFEIWKRLRRPALVEMSTFHHHLWYIRSRYVAWDHPNRGHKPFIDLHVEANEESRRMFLPGHLGWWLLIPWKGDPQIEPTYADDVEYLCCKALGTDTGFSLIGVTPETLKSTPAFERLSAITRQYEELRHNKYFSEAIKTRLREKGKEHTLVRKPDGQWAFRPVHYDRHKADAQDGKANIWTANNPFGRQPLKLRIETLLSAGPYDALDNPVMADFARPGDFGEKATAPGMTVELTPSPLGARSASEGPSAQTRTASDKLSPVSSATTYAAANQSAAPDAPTWTSLTRTYAPPLNLKDRQGMGLWINGDAGGEVLNFQLRSPEHLPAGYADHYVPIDFTGWRYVELIEAEGDRCPNYRWPYSGAYYDLYRETVYYDQVSSLGIWCTNVPAGKTATCRLGPIRALPLIKARLTNPAVTLNGRTVTFPVTMESGSYLEWTAPDDCKLYGPNGETLADVKPQGDPPTLEPGENQVEFHCGTGTPATPRARVTMIAQGDPMD